MRRLGYVPALDGLRGVAILLVIGEHYFHIPLGGGAAGVGLFFVLSGFLITTLLLEERDATGRIGLRAFYVRRARRLFPALAVLLLVYLIGAALQGRIHDSLRAMAAGGFYTANIAQSYWPHLIGREPIGPLWSLAEEEQFYLLWPAVLLAALAWKLRGRHLELIIAAAIIAVWAERDWLRYGAHVVSARAYASPEAAADGLLAGVLLALMRRRGYRVDPLFAGVAATLLAFMILIVPSPVIYVPMLDIAGFALVGLALERNTGAARVLSWKPLVWVGLISYSLYLWHMVVLSWFGYSQPWLISGYHDRGVALALAVGIAWLSYRFVETRFRHRRSPAPEGRSGRLALSGGAATAAIPREG